MYCRSMSPIRVASITSYVVDDEGISLASIIYHAADGSLRKISPFTHKEDILNATYSINILLEVGLIIYPQEVCITSKLSNIKIFILDQR